jgi:hypothetical protein
MGEGEGMAAAEPSAYPLTHDQLLEQLPDDDACLVHLTQLRWPGGFVCPVCGPARSWRTGSGLWICATCNRKTSVTSGTIFHRSRTPLTTWFAAIWQIVATENGLSAHELQTSFGFGSYDTAWDWLRKLRLAMVRPDPDRLRGVVEIGTRRVRGVPPLLIAVEIQPGDRLGRVRLQLAPAPGALPLLEFAARMVEPGSTVRTDTTPMLRRLNAMGYVQVTRAEPGESDGTDVGRPDAAAADSGIQRVALGFERWLIDTPNRTIADAELPDHIAEYAFRVNSGGSQSPGRVFRQLLQQAVNTDPFDPDRVRRRTGDRESDRRESGRRRVGSGAG